MKSFAVTIAASAQRQADRIDAWWRENRPGAPNLFDDELHAALVKLSTGPLGPIYRNARGRPPVLLILLARSSHHVYFRVDEDQVGVHVLAVWHAARGRGPTL